MWVYCANLLARLKAYGIRHEEVKIDTQVKLSTKNLLICELKLEICKNFFDEMRLFSVLRLVNPRFIKREMMSNFADTVTPVTSLI